MLPYWLLFALFAIGALRARAYRRDEPMLAFWFGWVVVTLMIGLRYRVGVDYGNYLIVWDGAEATDLARFVGAYGSDPVFYTLTWMMRQAGLAFWSLNLLCAVIFTSGLFRYARMQPNPWLAVAVAVPYLVIVIAMSGIRQAAALGLVFHALVAFRDQRTVAFLAWVAAGAAFHASAILILPLAGLSFAKTRFQAAALMAIIAVGGYFLLGSTFGEYSRDYLTADVKLQSAGTPYRVAMSVLAAVVFFLLRSRLQLQAHEFTLWRNLSLVALLSIPLTAVVPSSTALDRVLLYLFPLQIGVLAHAPFATGQKDLQRFAVTALILLYLAATLFVFMNYAVHRHSYLPYRMLPFAED